MFVLKLILRRKYENFENKLSVKNEFACTLYTSFCKVRLRTKYL